MGCSFKRQKVITITKALRKVDKSGCKPTKIWVDKRSEFYNRSIESWLQDSYIEMHSTNNEGNNINQI